MNRNLAKSNRVLSIDALRGFVMLLIIFADRFFITLNNAAASPLAESFAKHFDHAEWFGSKFYDIIMPLFLFVVGVVIPFSLSKRMQENTSKSLIYLKLLKRFVLLFILGWIVQGNLLNFDLEQFQVFSNTLQAIAVGYFFSCISYIHLTKKWRYFVFISCLIGYALLLTVTNVPGLGQSELLPDQNLALYIDHFVFGKFDDGTQYTWLLSGFGFTATTLSGIFAGELIKSKHPRKKITMYLVLYGIIGLILGMVWGIWHPIVKKIWTSSFVLASSGVCYLLLALFYRIIDVKSKIKWAFPLKVIGMNAITAYVLSHVFSFPKIADYLLFGLEKYLGAYYEVINTIGGFGLLYLLLWYMYKNNTFIKI